MKRARGLLIILGLLLLLSLPTPVMAQSHDNALPAEDLPNVGVYRLVATAFEDVAAVTGAIFSPDISNAAMNADGHTFCTDSGRARPRSGR